MVAATLTAPRARGAPSPADPALPALAVLLSAEEMAPFLHRSLAADAAAVDVRVHHVRYQPGKKAVVRYDVELEGRRYDAIAMIAARPYLARRAVKPESLALVRLVDGRSPAREPLRYEPELDALVQWYPLDLALPALAEPPARLLDELAPAEAELGATEPATLAYRPRRRAVLRVGEHVLKLYAKREDFEVAAGGLRAAGSLRGVRTPAFEGWLPKRLATMQSLLPGTSPSQARAVAAEAGELLRNLQSASPSNIAASPPFHQLATAGASAAFLVALVPALERRLQELLRRLEASVPTVGRLVLSHGDFSARQLLVTPGGVSVVDLDALRFAPAALDAATYAAHLVFGGLNDLGEATVVLEELLAGYGERPLGLDWYLATSILRHARSPFRYLDEHWPERIDEMVAAAEGALAP